MASLPLDRLFRIDGKLAVVTGGNSGIGRMMAVTLAEAGADVVLIARDVARLEQTARDIGQFGRKAVVLAANLGESEGVAEAVAATLDKAGSPDILVNAAAINERPSMQVLDEGVWNRTLRVNLDAPFLLARAFAPEMARRRWGRIINMASLQSIRSFNNGGAYGVSKAAIAQLTRALAEAWSSQGVNCNAIAPGFVETPMTRAVFSDPARAAAMAARTMIGRNGLLEDVRGLTAFLASPASDYITGQVLFLDGGFSAS